MFTGIVEERGEVVARVELSDSARLTLRGPLVTSELGHGDSVCVSGVCLTVVDVADGCFTADVMAETLDRSGLGSLRAGDGVNLERALTLASRLGGHLVQGHVDATGTVLARTPGAAWEVLRVSMPRDISRYVVEKGSVTVDGVSLTVSSICGVDDRSPWFEVSLIPTTLELTTLGGADVGATVNLEVDVLAKHVERLLAARA